MDEFELIQSFFINSKNQTFSEQKNITLGIGDDAAVFELTAGKQLVTCVDTLVAGVHFPEDGSAADIAYKSLAVNLSDLAAMGASLHSFTLSLTLPEKDELWLKSFSDSLFELANQHRLVLVGGDMSRGPLSVSIQLNGVVDAGKFLRRDAAKENDLICVTGHLGLAALGLQEYKKGKFKSQSAQLRFLRPEARLEFALGLYDLGVRCAIDISDGLLSEIGHLCRASKLSAKIDTGNLLVHQDLQQLSSIDARELMLSGGDDYELCFAVSESALSAVEQWAQELALPLSVIGGFQKQGNTMIYEQSGAPVAVAGYQHF